VNLELIQIPWEASKMSWHQVISDKNILDLLCMGYTLIEMGYLLSRTSSIPVMDLDK